MEQKQIKTIVRTKMSTKIENFIVKVTHEDMSRHNCSGHKNFRLIPYVEEKYYDDCPDVNHALNKKYERGEWKKLVDILCDIDCDSLGCFLIRPNIHLPNWRFKCREFEFKDELYIRDFENLIRVCDLIKVLGFSVDITNMCGRNDIAVCIVINRTKV